METRPYNGPSLGQLERDIMELKLHEKIYREETKGISHTIPIENIHYFNTYILSPVLATRHPQLLIAALLWYAEIQKSNVAVQAFVAKTLQITPENPLSFRRMIIYYVNFLEYLNSSATTTPGAKKNDDLIAQVSRIIFGHFFRVSYIHSAFDSIRSFYQIPARRQQRKNNYQHSLTFVGRARDRLAATFIHDRAPEREHQIQFIHVVSRLMDTLLNTNPAFHIEGVLTSIAYLLMHEIEGVEKTKTSTSILHQELGNFLGYAHTSLVPIQTKAMLCDLFEKFFKDHVNDGQWEAACPKAHFPMLNTIYFSRFHDILEKMRTIHHSPISVSTAIKDTVTGAISTLSYRAAQVCIAYSATQILAIGGAGAAFAKSAAAGVGELITTYGGMILAWAIRTPAVAATEIAVEKGLQVGLTFGLGKLFERFMTTLPPAQAEAIRNHVDPFNTFLTMALRTARGEEAEFLHATQRFYNNFATREQKEELLKLLPYCYQTKPQALYDTPKGIVEIKRETPKVESKATAAAPPPPPPFAHDVSLAALQAMGGVVVSKLPPTATTAVTTVVEPSAPPPYDEEDALEPGGGYVLA